MITALDFQILDFLQQHCRNSALDWFFSRLTHLGDAGIIWIVLALGLLLYPKTRRTGAVVAIALVLDLILCNGILKKWHESGVHTQEEIERKDHSAPKPQPQSVKPQSADEEMLKYVQELHRNRG